MDWRDKEQMLDVAANVLGYGAFILIMGAMGLTVFGLLILGLWS